MRMPNSKSLLRAFSHRPVAYAIPAVKSYTVNVYYPTGVSPNNFKCVYCRSMAYYRTVAATDFI